jgi:hypothetical protein
MKTSKQIGLAVMVFIAILIGTAGTPPSAKEKKHKKAVKVEILTPELQKQCGVTNEQITSYLVNCPHHHSVSWVRDIAGTCNSQAGIENCGTATVYVSDGNIVGHQDNAGYCGGSPSLGPDK